MIPIHHPIALQWAMERSRSTGPNIPVYRPGKAHERLALRRMQGGEVKTAPWQPDEYAQVDGQPYAYSREGDAMLVRFPGGGAATPNELAAMGCRFEYPKIARGWN